MHMYKHSFTQVHPYTYKCNLSMEKKLTTKHTMPVVDDFLKSLVCSFFMKFSYS